MSIENQWNSVYQRGKTPWQGVPAWLKRCLSQLDLTPQVALDLGCGTGEKSKWLAQEGYQVTGIDISAEAVKKASGSANSINFVTGDISDPTVLDFSNQSFGLVLDLLTGQFLGAANQQKLFDRIRELLSPSGVLIHSRLEPTANDASPWVSGLAVSPTDFEKFISGFQITWHESVASKNLPATNVHRYVLRLT